jgi:cellulose synthase/poly-beta-1,6-N-acetylglucosamine synthase-like glycosyltransferase
MIIFLAMALFSSGIIFILLVGHLIRLHLTKTYPPTHQFSVAVLVPCKGNNDPNFGKNLRGIIQQEYGGPTAFVFCVESRVDPALSVLCHLAQEFPNVQVCVAGLATRSAQKTHNILSGMALADEADIFIFADADIEPHRTWLQEMVAPFQEARIGAVTGCFRRVPLHPHYHLGAYLAGLFGAGIVAGMADDRLKSLWGGSMAIRRSVVDRLNLRERLATEIVDDIALMHAFHQHQVKRRFVPSCTLKSYCDMSLPESVEWLVRQFQFAQIYFKGLYLFFYVFGVPYAVSILATPPLFLYGLVSADRLAIGASLAFWLSVLLVGWLLRWGVKINPASVSPGDNAYGLLPWLLTTPLAFVVGTLALLKTLMRVKSGILTMYWRSIEYRVDVKTGKVLEIIR